MALTATTVSAHSMSPGYIKTPALGDTTSLKYEITNKFPYPAVFRIELFEKDGKTPVTGWTVNRKLFKMVPGSTKRFTINLDSVKERKLLVCSILDKVDYDEKEPTTITRVCSRLWLWR